jgi:hypothetical protein
MKSESRSKGNSEMLSKGSKISTSDEGIKFLPTNTFPFNVCFRKTNQNIKYWSILRQQMNMALMIVASGQLKVVRSHK